MNRWLHNLFNPILYEGENEGGSAPDSGGGGSEGGATPAATPDSGSAPAASSADGGSSTPPAGEAAPPSGDKRPQGQDDFDFLDRFEGDDLVPLEPPAAPAQAQAEPPAQPQAAPAEPAAPQQTPGGQVPQGAGAQAPGASPIPTDPGELVDSIRQNAPALVEQLASNYVLSTEEAEALENDVVGTLPKLFARVHLNATVGALHNMKQLIPKMIRDAIQGDRTKRDNLDAFYKAWPQLDKANPQHLEAISMLGGAYRRANPTASREQAIKAIGTLALHHLGLPLTPVGGGPNGRTVSQKPFVPAMGGGPAAPTGAPEPDPFAGMGMEFDD